MGDRTCVKCGQQVGATDEQCAHCGEALAARAGVGVKVGFWTRFLAALLDGIMVGVVAGVLALPFGRDSAMSRVISTLLGLAYSVYMIGSRGQTVGMMALSIKVIRTNGGSMDYVQAFVRWLGSIVSGIALGLGFLWIAWDPDKQGWHDKIADTYVVKA